MDLTSRRADIGFDIIVPVDTSVCGSHVLSCPSRCRNKSLIRRGHWKSDGECDAQEGSSFLQTSMQDTAAEPLSFMTRRLTSDRRKCRAMRIKEVFQRVSHFMTIPRANQPSSIVAQMCFLHCFQDLCLGILVLSPTRSICARR